MLESWLKNNTHKEKGATKPSIMIEMGISLESLEEALNGLEKKNLIYRREGFNSELIFWNHSKSLNPGSIKDLDGSLLTG